ncbi:MAG: diaminopimelate decarboxylase, partial [Elusimicrobiales bacterium]|nr:diaminopimelate decarboxylase [Elusimicrobiales bacterium]
MNSLIKYFPEDLVEEASKRFGTPLYVYSRELLEKQADSYIKAFAGMEASFCYAMKANSCRKFCSVLAEKGFGADVVSGGELFRALNAGFPHEKIIFSGTGKTQEELEYAVNENIFFINLESKEELFLLEEICRHAKKKCRISVRINPEVDPHTHAYISTGMSGSKFGVSFDEAFEMYKNAAASEYLETAAVHFHIGSQISSANPYMLASEKMRQFLLRLEKSGICPEYADIGGGWGVAEGHETPPPDALRAAAALLSGIGKKIILEPGRSIAAPCGIIVARVLYNKSGGGHDFLITDCGMNDFLRPALYGATHPIVALKSFCDEKGGSVHAQMQYDIAGPVCESSDFISRGVMLPKMRSGDLIAVLSAGAYGYSMSSNYNSRPRPAEILIENGGIQLIRRRESW